MTRRQQITDYFLAHPNTWIDGHVLAKLGGYAAYGSRIRDLRKAPPIGRLWRIDNREYDVERVWGTERVSEYMYVPAVTDVTPRRDGVTNCHDESVLTL